MKIKAEDIWYPFPEYWRDIKEYEGLYQVSNWGRVRALNWHGSQGVKLKGFGFNQDYTQVQLWRDGKCKSLKVHNLMSQAFLPNPNNLPIINHKSENRWENWIELDEEGNIINSNLEWCTVQYNNTYGTARERANKANINNSGLSKAVLQFSLDGRFIASYSSAAEAERQTNICAANISQMARQYKAKGKYMRHSVGGYIWKYKEKGEAS